VKKITLITSNANKAAELAGLLGEAIEHQSLELSEIQSLDVVEVASKKAKSAYKKLQTPVIVDDSGFVIEAWGKLPGPFIKYFLEEMGDAKITQLVGENRAAYAETVLAYCDENGVKVAVGRLNGTVAFEPRGENGYGYDMIFIPDGTTKTRAEMLKVEQMKFFPRGLAAEKLRKILEEKND
jgi:non-canonical purine NTP pyrophosphatase (RdgB/HAM1 family)